MESVRQRWDQEPTLKDVGGILNPSADADGTDLSLRVASLLAVARRQLHLLAKQIQQQQGTDAAAIAAPAS